MIDVTATREGFIFALLVSIAMSGAASPLDGLEEALRRNGVSSTQVAAIVSAADDASWEQISPGVDFAAVARSLTIESDMDRLTPGDLAELAHDLSREAETLERLGFTRREVARALSEGVRNTRDTSSFGSDSSSRATAAAAARVSRGRLRRELQEIAGRRGPPRGVVPPSVAQRVLDRPLPGGDRPITPGTPGPGETPADPDRPGGR